MNRRVEVDDREVVLPRMGLVAVVLHPVVRDGAEPARALPVIRADAPLLVAGREVARREDDPRRQQDAAPHVDGGAVLVERGQRDVGLGDCLSGGLRLVAGNAAAFTSAEEEEGTAEEAENAGYSHQIAPSSSKKLLPCHSVEVDFKPK
jgi:hypothetical protein